MPNRVNKDRCTWRVIALALAILAGAGRSAQAQTNDTNNDKADEEVILDEIVAKVNTEIITLTDLNAELGRLRRSIEAQLQDPQAQQQEFEKQRPQLLRNLILNKIIVQRAEELGMLANIDNELNLTIQNIMKENGIPDLDTFKRILQQQGTSYDEYRAALRERYIVQIMQQQFVYSKVTILGDEVEEYYKEHLDQFTDPAEVQVAEILFLTEGKNLQTVRAKAEDVLARLKAGEDFAALARQFSDGPTASDGGELSPFKKGQMVEKLENVAFALEQGQISDLVQTDYGLVILKLLSKKEATPRPLEEVHDQIVRILQNQKVGPYMKTFLDDLRNQSYVYISPKYREQYDVEDL